MLAHSRFLIMYICTIQVDHIRANRPWITCSSGLLATHICECGITAAVHHVPSNGHMPVMSERRASICQKRTVIQIR